MLLFTSSVWIRQPNLPWVQRSRDQRSSIHPLRSVPQQSSSPRVSISSCSACIQSPTRVQPPEPHDASISHGARKLDTVIVTGKFDAFHRGHRELARVAATLGSPTLLSFSGMAEALSWPPRAPVVAAVERDRVLREWSAEIGKAVRWKVLPFSEIRDYSPEQFVDVLRGELGACGIVCGRDWRFGRHASGDVALLRKLAAEKGMEVRVVDPVQLDEDVVISSTGVRESLAEGNVALAAKMLERPHRLVGYVAALTQDTIQCFDFVNQIPGDGDYSALVRVLGAAEPVRSHVRVHRPDDADPMKPPLVSNPDVVQVTIFDATQIFCDQCEVYIDFVDRIS